MRVPERHWSVLGLAAVLVGYLLLAGSYAVKTPLWQVPDEPAHYQYIAQLADDTPGPPVIAPGDYPHARLEQLKAAGFPPNEPVTGIAYEDHQPPLYYYLARPIFTLAGPDIADRVRALRWLGVLLGALTVALAWAVARQLTPEDPVLPVGAAGIVAFVPMHLTMNAAVNNDPLAYVLSGAALLVGLRRIGGRLDRQRFIVLGGLVGGLALWTKVTVYPLPVLLAAAEGLAWWRGRGAQATGSVGPARPSAGAALRTAAAVIGLALAIGLPWLARNAVVYGPADPLALRAHDAVVVGQPRTAEWIARVGPRAYATRLIGFTWQSFWGVFGWMGVFLDIRVYWALAAVSAAALAGLARYLVRLTRRTDPAAAATRAELALLGLTLAVTLAGFGWYNLSFVQHQGRYLFAALIPIAVLLALGLREVARIVGRAAGPAWLTRALEMTTVLGFAIGLAGLAWLSLTRYIVPGLS